MENNLDNKQVVAVPVSRNELNSIVNQFNGIKKTISEKITQGLEYASTDEFDQKIDQNVEKFKKTVKIVGTIATLALFVLPADGPIGEIASILATSTFVRSADQLADGIKDMYKSGKKLYVGSIKQNGGLNISSITDANTIENADNIKQDINAIKGSIVEMGEVVSSVRRH